MLIPSKDEKPVKCLKRWCQVQVQVLPPFHQGFWVMFDIRGTWFLLHYWYPWPLLTILLSTRKSSTEAAQAIYPVANIQILGLERKTGWQPGGYGNFRRILVVLWWLDGNVESLCSTNGFMNSFFAGWIFHVSIYESLMFDVRSLSISTHIGFSHGFSSPSSP